MVWARVFSPRLSVTFQARSRLYVVAGGVVQRFRLVSRFVVGRVLRWGGRARSGCWPVVGVGPWPGVLVPPAASRFCPRDEAAARLAPGPAGPVVAGRPAGPAATAGLSRAGSGGSVRGGGGGGSVGLRPA